MVNLLSSDEDTSIADKLFENLSGKISNKDLPKLNDETLNNLTYLKGKIDFELENKKNTC